MFKEHQILAVILGIGFLLRVSGIFWGIPYPDAFEGKYHPDEGQIIKGAVEFPIHILTNTFFVYPTFFSYFLGIITMPLRLFFDEVGLLEPGQLDSTFYFCVTLIGRVCSALAGTGTILLTYILAKDIYDQTRALLASALLAFTLHHAANSSFATTDVLTSFLLVLFLLLLRRAFLTPQFPSLFVFAGVTLGLLVGTKYTGAIASLAIVVLYIYTLAKHFLSPKIEGSGNLPKFHIHLLLCGGTAIVTFFLTNPGILIQFDGFTESMLWNFRYVERYSFSRIDLGTWIAVFQMIVMAVGLPIAMMVIWGIFVPIKKNIYEISFIVILVTYFFYFEHRLLPRYVIMVAPLMAIVSSHGALWLYDSGQRFIRVLGLAMIAIVLVYSLGYCVTGAYLRYNDTRTQAGHYVHKTFSKGTTLGIAYTSEKFGWTAHPWRYPKVDFTWFKPMDFLDYPEVVVVSSEIDTTRIEDALRSDKLSAEYVWNERHNKDWYQYSPPSPRVFRFYDELYDPEPPQYVLVKTFKKETLVPIEFASPEIRIYRALPKIRNFEKERTLLSSRIGLYGPPYTKFKSFYPSNPRQYFQKEDMSKWGWRLQVQEGNQAALLIPQEDPEVLRIAIGQADTHSLWHIQLNQSPWEIKANHNYVIQFRARSDFPRTMVIGVAQAYFPWQGLGLYQEVSLTTEWRDYDVEFMAKSNDDHARVFFDLGGTAVPVDISRVRLQRKPEILLASMNSTKLSSSGGRLRTTPSDQSPFLEPDLPGKYSVEYRLNAQGCRGRDYRIPRTTQGMRILVLGDSYALGAGVHEADTLASQLEQLLNQERLGASFSTSNEVINCGVGGYGTRDEAVLYETLVSRYQPDVVLLVMAPDDDKSWSESVKSSEFDPRAKNLNRLVSWSDRQEMLFQRSSPDYSESLQAIHDLQQSIQGRGARLAVVLFRNTQDQAWIPLLNQITQGLKDTTVPVWDLGPVLAESQSEEFLTVHENDKHPNEVAHKMAAGSVYAFLQQEGLFVFGDHGKLAER